MVYCAQKVLIVTLYICLSYVLRCLDLLIAEKGQLVKFGALELISPADEAAGSVHTSEDLTFLFFLSWEQHDLPDEWMLEKVGSWLDNRLFNSIFIKDFIIIFLVIEMIDEHIVRVELKLGLEHIVENDSFFLDDTQVLFGLDRRYSISGFAPFPSEPALWLRIDIVSGHRFPQLRHFWGELVEQTDQPLFGQFFDK